MNRKDGFTLIELIVVVGIIIILSGISIAAYFRFSQRQAAMNDARNFSTLLRRVQALSRNLVYPNGCSNLSGYRVYTKCNGDYDNCRTVFADALCGMAAITVISDEKVLDTTSFSVDINVTFLAGSGNIPEGEYGTYSLANTNDSYVVNVTTDKNGVIGVNDKP